DWFVAVNSLQLFENNEWLESTTISLKVYDAGSDSGPSFKSANSKTSPKGIISLLTSDRVNTDFDEGVHFKTKEAIGHMDINRVN
ncbi:MAG: elongation factor Ts, partial [Gammaproteobacteria bacterium]|nr:elongation factor Ts [Gammaproteobacteria bacterium]